MSRLPRYGRIAQAAVDRMLRARSDEAYVMLFSVHATADQAAAAAGRKSELFDSLYEYDRLLPDRSETRWIEQGSGSLLVATNPHYQGDPPPELQREHQPIPGPFGVATDAHVQLG